MAEEDEELLAMFVQEAGEHLGTIEPDLLVLEQNGSDTEPEIINRLFRGVHSIKGSAGFFGLTAISSLSHVMENLLGKVREHSIEPTAELTDSLLAGMDKLKGMIENVADSETIDATEEKSAIQAILDGKVGAPPPQQKPSAATPAPEPPPEPAAAPPPETAAAGGPFADLGKYADAVQDAVNNGKCFYAVKPVLSGNKSKKKKALDEIRQLISTVGSVLDTDPPIPEGQEPADFPWDNLTLLVSTVLEADLLAPLIQVADDQVSEVPLPKKSKTEAAAAPPAKPAAPPPAAASRPPEPAAEPERESEEEEEDTAWNGDGPRLRPGKPAKPKKKGGKGDSGDAKDAKGGKEDGGKSAQLTLEETLRVSVALLDELINMAGELVLTRNQLTRAVVGVTSEHPNLAPLVQNLDSITSRIQEKVMHARMQPVSFVFNKFPRIVRDLAKKLDKKIDLDLRGGDVELDKSVIEHLSDPLTHMIRNVADHAIETPKERLAAGKPETGRVELSAYHENGMVNISLSDDGAGIDAERIKKKAVEKGVITDRQAETISQEEALELIFAPGFSMAKKVTDVSGRGVGMDVVRTNIEKLRGTVHISSKVGEGTRIILKLPLTLAIIPAMIVSAGHQRFAIPEIGLVEIVRVVDKEMDDQIQMVCNAPVLRLRNMLLPLVDLADVLGVQAAPSREGPPGQERRLRWLQRHVEKKKAGKNSRANRAVVAPPKNGRERRSLQSRVVYIMVINVSGNEFGMVVDAVLDSEEIVVKPLPSFFKGNVCFSATTILGDGSVALIIDYAGIMEKARINFSNVEQAALAAMNDKRRTSLREKQNIILLETAGGQKMGIPTNMVGRVEKIATTAIEVISGKPYVRYSNKTYRAIFPGQVLGLEFEGFQDDGNTKSTLCMVIPNVPGLQAGLVFSKIIDTLEIYIDLDQQAVQIPGLFGTTRINDRVVLLPDLYAVFEMADVIPPQAGPRMDYSGLNALVVDDTPFLRVLTASYLEQIGFEVEQARDGEMGLTLLNNNRFDLLVTDLNMPVLSGFEMVKELRDTPNRKIPMIATTASITLDLENRCNRAGFIQCVPVMDKRRLLEAVATLTRV